jgi:hypothetical protein
MKAPSLKGADSSAQNEAVFALKLEKSKPTEPYWLNSRRYAQEDPEASEPSPPPQSVRATERLKSTRIRNRFEANTDCDLS